METTRSIVLGCLLLACCLLPVESAPAVVAFASNLNLFPVQVASAAASYVGLVALLDRARGTLNVGENQVTVAPSAVEGAGLGLYCVAPSLPKGTILGTYPGAVIALDQNMVKLYQAPSCESYIWRFSDSKFVIDPTDEEGNIQGFTYGGNPSTFGSVWICRNILGFLAKSTVLCRINEPPIGRDVNVCTDEDLKSRTVTFRLERDVYQGEEFFMDYGITYDRSNYGEPK